MNVFLGLGWDEWASIIAIITGLSIFSGWIFKRVSGNVLRPVFNQLKRLTDNIKVLNSTISDQRQSISQIDERLDAHDSLLIRHDEKINDLHLEVFKDET